MMSVSNSGFFSNVRVLASVCFTEVWQNFLDELEAQVEFRRGFPRIRIVTHVVPQQAKGSGASMICNADSSAVRNSGLLFARHEHERDARRCGVPNEPLRLSMRQRPRHHHSPLIQFRQVNLPPRGFRACRIVDVPSLLK